MTTTERPNVQPIECTPWCHSGDGHPNDWCREDQVCWSDATYVQLSREPIHGDDYGDYPPRLGVMARRDREAAVVYLHLDDILIRPGAWPDVLHHCLSLTADEAKQLAGALLETAKLVRSTPPDSG
jgi:hypothetical protein